MRFQGKITNWKDEQGFGFIVPNGGGRQVFVHIRSFSNRRRRPVGNEIVTYELKTDAKGRAYAETVAFVGEPKQAATSGNNIFPLLTVVFVAFVAGAVFSADCRLSFSGSTLSPALSHSAPMRSTSRPPGTISGERRRAPCISLLWSVAGPVRWLRKDCCGTSRASNPFKSCSGSLLP